MFKRFTTWAESLHNYLRPRDSTHEQEQAAIISRLTTSRREIVEAYERERNRIERDLHDGAQQYFVAVAMAIGEARLINSDIETDLVLNRAEKLLFQGLENLRSTVHGIQPQTLSSIGLASAVRQIAQNFDNRIVVKCPYELPQLEPAVLAAAYFFASEALTNAAKYAEGSPVNVLIVADEHLRISIVDQGPGGAQFVDQGGLSGMRDRIEAFDGTMRLYSPSGGPTHVAASIPLMLRRGEPGMTGFGNSKETQ